MRLVLVSQILKEWTTYGSATLGITLRQKTALPLGNEVDLEDNPTTQRIWDRVYATSLLGRSEDTNEDSRSHQNCGQCLVQFRSALTTSGHHLPCTIFIKDF